MMKILTCLLAVRMTAGLAAAQTIDEIQFYDPVTGDPASPYDGQNVTVEGVVYVPRRRLQLRHPLHPGRHRRHQLLPVRHRPADRRRGEHHRHRGYLQRRDPDRQPEHHLPRQPRRAHPTPATTGEIATDYERVGDFVAVTGEVTSKDGNSQFEMATPARTP